MCRWCVPIYIHKRNMDAQDAQDLGIDSRKDAEDAKTWIRNGPWILLCLKTTAGDMLIS